MAPSVKFVGEAAPLVVAVEGEHPLGRVFPAALHDEPWVPRFVVEDRIRELEILGLPESIAGAPVVVEWPGEAILTASQGMLTYLRLGGGTAPAEEGPAEHDRGSRAARPFNHLHTPSNGDRRVRDRPYRRCFAPPDRTHAKWKGVDQQPRSRIRRSTMPPRRRENGSLLHR